MAWSAWTPLQEASKVHGDMSPLHFLARNMQTADCASKRHVPNGRRDLSSGWPSQIHRRFEVQTDTLLTSPSPHIRKAGRNRPPGTAHFNTWSFGVPFGVRKSVALVRSTSERLLEGSNSPFLTRSPFPDHPCTSTLTARLLVEGCWTLTGLCDLSEGAGME